MKQRKFSALDPFGGALLAYYRGNKSTQLIQEYKSGRKVSIPASVFFRNLEDFYPTENAFVYCRGRILVVGAGTGVHALELEWQKYQVTAIDVNTKAVQIMKERGVKDIRKCDFFEFSGELYDTILMLGHNIGMCETVDRIKILLQKCKSLISQGGQLLLNSIDESSSPETTNHQGYPGELEFRLSHEGNFGPWMRWLHVDFETLSSKAFECGWSTEKLIEDTEGGFLARLSPL
jgi:2-polyprenyl-3-methyl-5-hydroxy-6-metoxy-1,4-benzoquinol methylase